MELAPVPLFILCLFFSALSPDSVQLPVVSIMKEVVVGGSGGAIGWTKEECVSREVVKTQKRVMKRGKHGEQDSGLFGFLIHGNENH